MTATLPAPARLRAPLPVRAAVVLLVLLMAVSAVGLVLFGFVLNDDPLGPGLVFAAVALAAMGTALAALPGLLRGDRTRWLVVAGWVLAYDYWSVYKVFGEQEYESLGLLVTGLLVGGLLAAPATRRFVALSAPLGR